MTSVAPGERSWIWIFNGAKGTFPSGVFGEQTRADAWIRLHKLTGTLTRYPVDIGVYDWAIAEGFFIPRRDAQRTSDFIGRFSTASQEHYHYEEGHCRALDPIE